MDPMITVVIIVILFFYLYKCYEKEGVSFPDQRLRRRGTGKLNPDDLFSGPPQDSLFTFPCNYEGENISCPRQSMLGLSWECTECKKHGGVVKKPLKRPVFGSPLQNSLFPKPGPLGRPSQPMMQSRSSGSYDILARLNKIRESRNFDDDTEWNVPTGLPNYSPNTMKKLTAAFAPLNPLPTSQKNITKLNPLLSRF